MKNLIIIFLLIFLLFSINKTFSQCDFASIKEADKSYSLGSFQKVIDNLQPCVNAGISDTLKVEAYRLLSKTYIAIDDDSSAVDAASKLLQIQPDFQPDNLSDPLKFIELIEKLKLLGSKLLVTSVSKKAENIYEAPATVISISKEEFIKRGYLDFEAMCYDLPGFDISRSNGSMYSHIYQRGYRSINTNRTLLLVDGMEDNDLWSSNVYLSRQFPLSNFKNVEVVYGPASTMYGSNAFLGVINIITKDPDEIIKPGKNIGISAIIGYGSFNTKFIDGTFAAKNKKGNVSFSITARGFLSDEQDLSKLPGYTFAPREYSDSISKIYHKALDIKDSTKVVKFLTSHPESHDYYNLNEDFQIILTEDGVKKALELDNLVYQQTVPSDYCDDRSVYAKLKISDFTLGWFAWSENEGQGAQYNDNEYFTANQGVSWSPVHNNMYVKYETYISKKLFISNMMRFKVDDFSEENKLVRFRSYRYSYGRSYTLPNLLNGDIPRLDSTYLFQKSNQLRNEFKIVYTPTSKIDILAGFEARYSVLQGDYITNTTGNTEEIGVSLSETPAGNHFFVRDLGLYTQSTYRILSSLKLTAGLRYDNNIIRNTGGYGNVFNPRFSIVFYPNTFVFKVIYAEAFKDATNREKFSTVAGKRELTNPGLKPEKVKNIELSIGKSFFDENLNVNVAGYFARYSNIIQEVSVDTVKNNVRITTNQNQGVGQQEVYGINGFLSYKIKNLSIYGNYTFTNPWAIDPVDSKREPILDVDGNPIHKLRIGDIATHQANLGADYMIKDFLDINLRMNFVGKRIVGENTTTPNNKAVFNPYLLINGAVTYYHTKTGISIQLLVNNITNLEYYSPGLDQVTYELSSKLPQNPINFNLKMMFEF